MVHLTKHRNGHLLKMASGHLSKGGGCCPSLEVTISGVDAGLNPSCLQGGSKWYSHDSLAVDGVYSVPFSSENASYCYYVGCFNLPSCYVVSEYLTSSCSGGTPQSFDSLTIQVGFLKSSALVLTGANLGGYFWGARFASNCQVPTYPFDSFLVFLLPSVFFALGTQQYNTLGGSWNHGSTTGYVQVDFP